MAGELPAAQAPLEGQIQTQIRSIRLIRGAEQALGSIHDHITGFDSLASADHVLRRILEVAERLATLPERGSHSRELRALGIRDYRQTMFKPYCVIGKKVYINLVADGRRHMQSLLARRLFGV